MGKKLHHNKKKHFLNRISIKAAICLLAMMVVLTSLFLKQGPCALLYRNNISQVQGILENCYVDGSHYVGKSISLVIDNEVYSIAPEHFSRHPIHKWGDTVDRLSELTGETVNFKYITTPGRKNPQVVELRTSEVYYMHFDDGYKMWYSYAFHITVIFACLLIATTTMLIVVLCKIQTSRQKKRAHR